MKRDKDGERKLMEPLFPRVHLRDTEKASCRAPPRNKMALYERFSLIASPNSTFNPGYETASSVNFSVQKSPPPVISVPVSRELHVQRSDAMTVVISSGSAAASVLENGTEGIDQCRGDAEMALSYGDGERGNVGEISSCLDDDGVLPPGRSDDESYAYTNVSDVSMVDSGSGRGIPPDDVVGSIGQERFWRAKHAICKQQRLFAKQVFELHRLVKVQRLIAQSPHLVLHDNAAIKVKPRLEDDERGPESSAENAPGKNPSLPSNRLRLQAMPMVANPGRSFQQSSGNHWLIPVMSPSEGLVYKPCPAPPGFRGWGHFCHFACLPLGFPAPPPLIQQEGPFSLPVAHPMLGYCPPYNIPVTYPTAFPGMHTGQRTQSNRASSTTRDQSSSNMPGPANGTAPRVTRETVRLEPRRQGEGVSRGSSSLRDSDGTTVVQPGRVVRAVPCNPRLASESAARIFRTLQRERTRL